MAGALGVRLGGRNVYFGRSEMRPFLGDGPRPEARHLKRAARISGAVGLAALGAGAAGVTRGWPVGARPGRRDRPGGAARRARSTGVGRRGERAVSGGLLVAGTTSDAGKSVLTAGICRWLHRQGVRVAPFKAQNMSNNSAVVVGPDGRGGEIGRAQAMQAAACGLAPDLRFNPVLLKPGSDLRQPGGAARRGRSTRSPPATSAQLRPRLAETAFAAPGRAARRRTTW